MYAAHQNTILKRTQKPSFPHSAPASTATVTETASEGPPVAGAGLASEEGGRPPVAGKAAACGAGEEAAAGGWPRSSGGWKKEASCGVAARTFAKRYLCHKPLYLSFSLFR